MSVCKPTVKSVPGLGRRLAGLETVAPDFVVDSAKVVAHGLGDLVNLDHIFLEAHRFRVVAATGAVNRCGPSRT